MCDASRLPQLSCELRPSPAIPAPTQSQGKQIKEIGKGHRQQKGNITKSTPASWHCCPPGKATSGKVTSWAACRSTWTSHSKGSGCLKRLMPPGSCQTVGSHVNLDAEMHKGRFKWQKEVGVTDQDSFSGHIHSGNRLNWK